MPCLIEDLSVNYVERLILLEGHAVQRVNEDYGYDILMWTFEHGNFENGMVNFQLKATDGLKLIENGKTIAFKIERADLNTWRRELYPVIFVVYDALVERAYWLHFQEYCRRERIELRTKQKTLTIHIPIENVVGQSAIVGFRQLKNDIVTRMRALGEET